MNKFNREKGQIIIILALGLVGLLALTALALDGSRVYNERRTDQSTADSASLAGAGAAAQSMKDSAPSSFYCGSALGALASTNAANAAVESALADDINLVINDFSTGNGVQVTCGKNLFATYLDVRVKVTTEMQTTFATVIGQDTLTTVVESTARVYPKQPAAYGNAIVSLSNSCGNIGGIDFGGNGNININKGGIFSNSCIYGGGSSNVSIVGGDALYYTAYTGSCPGAISPCPMQTAEKLPDLNIKEPICTGAAYGTRPAGDTISPGNYNGIKVNSGDTLRFSPGLYCLKGDFDVNANATIWAENVTLRFNSGTTKFNGSAELHLTAPNCENSLCGVGPAVRGILMYIPPENEATITLNGSALNDYVGTIYGPTTNFKINGTSYSDTFNTQIIGNKVNFSGNANMFMNMEGAELYQQPSWVELLK